ncbi:MAG: FG-GAP-like repeat-containing protein [Leptospirales bacterium]
MLKINGRNLYKLFLFFYIMGIISCTGTASIKVSPLFGEKGGLGAVTLLLTDFPLNNADVTQVNVNFSKIEIHSEIRGWETVVDYGEAGKTFDLLKLQNGVTDELGSFSLQTGVYTQIRLYLNDTNELVINKNGQAVTEPLKVPSGVQTGIKLNRSFEITAQGYTTFTVDFNAQKSISHNDGQGYLLKPVIKIIDAKTTKGAGQTVSAENGGSVSIVNEISVDVPAGALNTDTQIEILPLSGRSYAQSFSSDKILSKQYELLPDGTQFNNDITITIDYDPAEVAALGIDETTLQMAYYDEQTREWVKIGGTVDLAANTVTAQVNHFTAFVLGGNTGAVKGADILNAGGTLTEVPERVTATVAPNGGGTVTSVILHYFINGVPQSSLSMNLNGATGLYETFLPGVSFYPDVLAASVQMCIEATSVKGKKTTTSLAPAGCSSADPLTNFEYLYNPDAELPASDGMNDRWEFDNGLDPSVDDSAGDLNGDGITNLGEYRIAYPTVFNATISGTATGLVATELLVIDNNGENLNVLGAGTGNDVFQFVNTVSDGIAYNVTVITSPAGKNCTATGGSGIIAGANIANVSVDCISIPTGQPGVFLDTDQNHFTFSLALGDIDGDGDQDRVEGNLGQPNKVYTNDGTGSFTDSGQYLGSGNTYSIALGDVDGDGDLDIVEGNSFYSGEANKVYLNDGAGNFTDSGQSLGLMSATRAVALGDVDGDGDLDIVEGNLGADKVYLNDGTGTFIDSGQSFGTNYTSSIVLGDVNGDGAPDLVEGNKNWFGIQANKVYLNDGTGVFTDSGQSLGLNNTTSVALGDVNGDGATDIVAGNEYQANSVYLNDGAGTFTASVQSPGANVTNSVVLGDVNGDGVLDIVEGNRFHTGKIYLNDGTGSFTDTGSPIVAYSTNSVVLGDMNGDGALDMAEVGYLFTVIYLNDGAGNFIETGQSLATGGSWSVALGDVNGDGTLDLVQGNAYRANKVYLNDGTGTFTDTGQSLGSSDTRSIALGDVDGDLDLDIVAGNGNPGQPNKVYLNDGAGTFTDSGQSLGISFTSFIVLGDVNGDGALDIVEGTHGYGQGTKVYLNNGTGVFTDSGQTLSIGPTLSIALGDVNGDGALDIVEGNLSEVSKVYLNDGSGTFINSGQSLGALWGTHSVVLGDLDGDGDLDLVVGNDQDRSNQVYLNDGAGTFTDSNQSLGVSRTYSLVLGDVDGDNDLDIIEGNIGQTNNTYWNLTY